jgi:hypothetical protein
MIGEAKQCDKVGKSVWQHIAMTTQCSQFVASCFARHLETYNRFVGSIKIHFN